MCRKVIIPRIEDYFAETDTQSNATIVETPTMEFAEQKTEMGSIDDQMELNQK